MGVLGDVLEKFYDPTPTFRTVHALIHHTRTDRPGDGSTRHGIVIGRPRPGSKTRGRSTETLSIWAVPPERLRIETSRASDEHRVRTIEVMNGDDAWNRHADGTVEKGRRGCRRTQARLSLPTEYERHFDRDLIRQFFAALTLQSKGTTHLAGRECVRIRAIQVPGTQLWPHWLAWDADEFELAIDAERAVLLSILGVAAGEVVESHEVFEVSFDGEFDDSLFAYEPELNESVIPLSPTVERVSWDGARAKAPFKVLTPVRLPERERIQCDVMYHTTAPDNPVEYLSIQYRGGTTFQHLWITERAVRDAEMEAALEWDRQAFGNRHFDVSDPGADEGLRVIAFEQDGTHVCVVSDLPIDSLLDLAASFAVP